MAFLEVKNLTRIYGKKENQLTALDHVSFSVERGEFVAVTGASGSGKSTLLHLLGTMDDAQDGSVKLEGEDVLGMKEKQKAVFRRRRIGFVFQEYNLVPVLNVEENIQIPVRLDGKQMDRENFGTGGKKISFAGGIVRGTKAACGNWQSTGKPSQSASGR